VKKELLAVALGLATFSQGCAPSGNKTGQGPDIENLLMDLAKKPIPENLSPGAMCYEAAAVPDRAEHVCQSCGTKTIHTEASLWEILDNQRTYHICVDELKKLGWNVKLDESFLCSKCRKAEMAGFYLEITYNGQTATNKLTDSNDIRKLLAFAKGNDVWQGGQGAEYPLKPELPRIRELLGVK